jgi:hypothetical protein
VIQIFHDELVGFWGKDWVIILSQIKAMSCIKVVLFLLNYLNLILMIIRRMIYEKQ